MQANYGLDALGAIAQTLKTHCGWSEARCQDSIARYKKLMANNCIPDYALGDVLGEEAAIALNNDAAATVRRSVGEAQLSLR